jgi:hypothetical protein
MNVTRAKLGIRSGCRIGSLHHQTSRLQYLCLWSKEPVPGTPAREEHDILRARRASIARLRRDAY